MNRTGTRISLEFPGEFPQRQLLQRVAGFLLRYGLVLVIGWIGAMKFTAYEADGVKTYVENSPFLSWLYGVTSVRGVAKLFGVVELTTAFLLAIRSFSARLSAVGSLLAIGQFLTTLSFLFTTPTVWAPQAGGFPGLSGHPGQFLLKDVVLLGAAVWTLGDALNARRTG